MTSPRILHVHSGNMVGGIERMLCTVARRHPASTFALSFSGPVARELETQGNETDILGEVRFSRPWSLVRFRRRLETLLHTRQPNAVICHAPWSYSAAAPAVRRAGIPLALWLHGATTGRHWLERLSRRTRPDLLIANSAFTAHEARKWLRRDAEIIHPPVEYPTVDAGAARARVRKELGAAPDAFVIAQVGRPEPGKGLDLHVRALAQLRDGPDWAMWYVGGAQRTAEAHYLETVRREAAHLGVLDRMTFAGARNDIADILAASDIYCQPNISPEGFGITLVEALYAGRPVITTNMGAAPEIVDPTCGILVAPSAPQVAEAIDALQSEDRRNRLGVAGRARARRLCDPEGQVARLTHLVARLTDGGSP
jgi:glycosyltransferase involved in cell wall biosynthesis